MKITSKSVLFAVFLSAFLDVKAADIQYENLNIPDQSGKIMTVLGQITPDASGATLMHEHLFLKFFVPTSEPERWKKMGLNVPNGEELKHWNEPFDVHSRTRVISRGLFSNRDALTLDNIADMVTEALAYRQLGGKTIVDVTPAGLGRQPLKLRETARKTNMNIVMGTGFYRRTWHPKDMDQLTQSDLTRIMVREIVKGVDNTGIKAGIIGEIPAEDLTFEPADSNEVRVLRAAARASRLTGAAITLHSDFGHMNNLRLSLDILEQEGADLSRVVMGHIAGIASKDVGFLESLLKRGVYLEFDTLGFPLPWVTDWNGLSSRPMVDAIIALITRGYADRILFSQDLCTKFQMTKYGGYGLTYIHTELIPYLLQKGIKKRQIEDIMVENPRRVLTFSKPEDIDSI